MAVNPDKRYKITNEENGLVLDVSGSNGKSVLGWEFHGGENQQWVMERRDEGQWALRSVWTQAYLGFEDNTPKDGTPLDAIGKPQHWDIEFLPGSEDHDDPRVKFWVRGTLLVVEFPIEISSGGPLRLWAAREGKNQVWVLEEYP